ncbi:hypothetical protein ACFV1L_20440 [Kitasatospora sp. NPDC059646]|uniref:hypothetical protein n=1 Tax=Kitasatospora sp. NPDC059646 TaxID=3346893 RepID=UPI003681E6A5
MSTDQTPEETAAETEAVLSLQESGTAEAEDVEAHAASLTSVAMCDIKTGEATL